MQIRRLFAWARANRIPVISTVLRYRDGWRNPLSPPPYCIEGTKGERKITGTLMRTRINFGLLNTTDLPRNVFKRYRQVIFEKRHTDIFLHARAERLITELDGSTFIICGAGVASGIVQAAVGLSVRGSRVVVASDAVLELDDRLSEMAYLQMEAKGVIFAPICQIVAPRPARRPRRSRSRKAVRAR